MEIYGSYRPQQSVLQRYTSPSVSRRDASQSESLTSSSSGQLLCMHRSSSTGRGSSNGRTSTDKSMLPGHSGFALSSKLEATRQAFKIAQGANGRPLSAGPRPRSGCTGRPGSNSGLRGSDPSPLPRRPGERPRALTCYLCGQQYGSASLLIHIPQCQKKWIAVEETKPKRERRPLPPPPPGLAAGELPTGKGADDFNESMYQHWDQHSLVGCPHCARTFRPEAFEKHKKVCTAANPGGPLGPGRNQPLGKAGSAAASPGRPASPASRGAGAARPGSGAAKSSPPQAASGGGQARSSTGGGGGGMASKPLGFTCYLCGQQYGSASLIIHIGQCQKKWVSVENTKPKREQRPLPPPPPIMHELEALPTAPQAIEEFNQAMYSYWDKVSLVGCSICGRTFRLDAFEHHVKVCTPDNPGTAKPGGPGPKRPPSPARSGGGGGSGEASRGGGGGGGNCDARPRAYNCYLCGQQYGSQSLLIHIPQCYEKWLKVEATKPLKERREPPPPPPELDEPLPTHPDEIDVFNARMCSTYNDQSLMRCNHCGRSMRPDALPRHQKLCTAENPMKGGGGTSTSAGGSGGGSCDARAGSGLGSGPAAYAEGGEEEVEERQHCNRRMRQDALTKHQRMCTADKPIKAVTRQPQPPSQPRPPSAGMGAPRGQHSPQQPNSVPQATFRPHPPLEPPLPAQDKYPGPEDESGEYHGTQAYAGYNAGQDGDMDGDAADDGDRTPCDSCGRKFAPEALAKHARICAKVFANKRKPFNMAKQRLQGTGAAPTTQRVGRPGTSNSTAPARTQDAQSTARSVQGAGAGGGVPNWKAQSESLRQAMAAQRQVTAALARGENLRDLPPPPSIPDPSFIQCPHCSRRFNQKAAERHIAACANTIAKPKFLKGGTGGSGQGAPQSRRLPRY